jgi:hypothetical protein
MRRVLGLMVALACGACSHANSTLHPSPANASASAQPDLLYVDPALGFEIARPRGDGWRFSPGEGGSAAESVAVPVIVAHRQTGAQVVVQVAPAVATPAQFAERLTTGLRTRPGFMTTEIQPIALADGAVGFAFTMGDQVAGRVAVVGGNAGRVYVLLATWPQDAPPAVITGVDEILRSLKTINT